jgi:succinate dehydrogenase cytochrome b556 subunit
VSVATERGGQTSVGLWDWLNLYATGVLLVLFLLAHIWAVHYAVPGEQGFDFRQTREKMRLPIFAFLDLGLLVLAMYHGLAGLRRVIVDLEVLGPRGLRAVTALLALLGLGGLYYGWLIYRAFVG